VRAGRRASLAALAAAAALAGCPLPQPLPDYPPGTITPPRILVDGVVAGAASTVQLVPASCPPGSEPSYPLTVQIHDTNNIESVDARWFVNYHPEREIFYGPKQSDEIPPDADPIVLTRTVPPRDPDTGEERPYLFRPYEHPPAVGTPAAPGPPYPNAGIVRVVELVVSNGFDPSAVAPPAPLPYRTTLPGFETQVYRWVFLTVAQDDCAGGAPGCVPVTCPQP
jgi:hypothetical protein